MWSAAMEVNSFDADNAYIGHFMSGSWDVNATTAAVAETTECSAYREVVSLR
jgi:hypothetical protein